MKNFGVFLKPLQGALLVTIVAVCLTDIIPAADFSPQQFPENSKIDSDKTLPPKILPKDAILGELPPAVFPDDKALQSYAISTTTRINKSVLSNKETELDNTTVSSNKNSDSNSKSSDKKPKVEASEVQDLLKTDMNIPVYEDTTENPVNNDTETVTGPHVLNVSKTHEEDVTKSTIDKRPDISKNETVKKDHLNIDNNTLTNITVTNKTIEANHSNEKDLISSTPKVSNVNETEIKQNFTESTTIEDVTSNVTDFGNITTTEELEHSGNETEIPTTKNVENVTDVYVNSTSTSMVRNSTVITDSDNTSIATKTQEKSKSDNKTIQKDDKVSHETSTIKPIVSTKLSTSTQRSKEDTTVQATLKVETSTMNISENIIDHKADIPMALAASQQHADHSHASTGKSSAFLQPTESAAILAGVFVGIALLGYVGLLVWRRVLEKRYGNREMLVNEDDFYDTNDLRNFEL